MLIAEGIILITVLLVAAAYLLEVILLHGMERQIMIVRSSAEAEFRVTTHTACEMIWV